MNHIARINQAEAIVLPLFDKTLFDLNAFSVIEANRNNGMISQGWDACYITSDAGSFSIRWQGEIVLDEYDAIRFFVNFPEKLLLTGTAIVNQKQKVLFKDIQGGRAPLEPTTKPLKKTGENALLTEFVLTFHSSCDNSILHSVNLYWVGLLNTAKEHTIEDQLPKWCEQDWTDLLNMAGRPGIRNNLFFSEQELIHMKKRMETPYFLPAIEKLKSEASYWENFNPEREIREYVPVETHLYRYVRVRDRNRTPLYDPILFLAIAGYLLDRPDLARLSARMILSIAVTPKWFEGPQGCTPGSGWHHVCFCEDHYMSAIAIALGFIGDVLTEKGLQLVLDKLECAWHWVNKTCEEPGYRWFMNQGLVGNFGRMIGAVSLYDHGRPYETSIEKSYWDHTRIVNTYINEEGHCAEGSGYYQYSFSNAIPTWMAYARYKGVDIFSVLPERFGQSIRYVASVMSTNQETGYVIPINKSGYKPLNTVLLVFLASVCQWPDAGYYIQNRLKQKTEETVPAAGLSGLDLLILLRYLPERFPDRALNHKGFIVFKKSGLFSYHFDTPFKGKFLFLCERNPLTAHYNEDRGSFVLEAGGKTVLPDLGTTNYAHPASSWMGKAAYHNLAYPEGLNMRIADPKAIESAAEAGLGCKTVLKASDFTCPGPRLESAEETENGLVFGVDLKEVYDSGEVLLAKRTGRLMLDVEGGHLSIEDTWELTQKRALNITYLSYFPWEIKGHSACSVLEDMILCIEITERHDLEMEICQQADIIDSTLRSVFALRIKTQAAKKIKVCSGIRFRIGI